MSIWEIKSFAGIGWAAKAIQRVATGRRNSRNPLETERIGGIAKGTKRRSSSDFAKEGTAVQHVFPSREPQFTKADVSSADREIPLLALRWRCRVISTSNDLPN